MIIHHNHNNNCYTSSGAPGKAPESCALCAGHNKLGANIDAEMLNDNFVVLLLCCIVIGFTN